MTTTEAKQHGTTNGKLAARHCDPLPGESRREAAFSAEMNARQYAGHMPTEIHRRTELFDAYERGVADGITSELEDRAVA